MYHGRARGCEMSALSDLYRVVATRHDGTTIVLVTHLANDRARAVVDALSPVSAFRAIEIQREPEPKPAGNQPGAGGPPEIHAPR